MPALRRNEEPRTGGKYKFRVSRGLYFWDTQIQRYGNQPCYLIRKTLYGGKRFQVYFPHLQNSSYYPTVWCYKCNLYTPDS